MARRLPSLTALKAFEATARLGGPTLAAQELFVTQSAVSRHVRALEEELGLPLFRRVHRGLVLTPEGRALASVLTQSLERVAETIDRLTRDRRSLKLRALPSFGVRWLWPRLYRFEARNPDVRLNVDILWHQMQPEDVEHDCGIRVEVGPWPERAGTVLMGERLTPVCSPSFAAAHPLPRTAEDFAGAPLLHGSADRRDWHTWSRSWSGGRFDAEHGTVFDMMDMALRAAEAGRGIAMADVNLIGDDLAVGRLLAPWPDVVASGESYVFVARDRDEKPAIAALRDWLVEEAAATLAAPLRVGSPP
jgi:LysR family glycine cleavage system transcriptional activator